MTLTYSLLMSGFDYIALSLTYFFQMTDGWIIVNHPSLGDITALDLLIGFGVSEELYSFVMEL